jgi:purine-binding chemotaxis protein CheW
MTDRFIDVLVFEIDGRRFGVAAADVREVCRAVAVVPFPKAPPIVEGVVNVRGTAAPVLDIRARFGLAARPLHIADHLILAYAGRRLVGLRVDRAVDLVRIDSRNIDDARSITPAAGYVAGVAKLPDGLILIHDLSTFLSQAESEALAELEREGGTA